MQMDNLRKFYLFLVVFFTATGLVIGHVINGDQYCDLVKVTFGLAILGYGAEYALGAAKRRFGRGSNAPSATEPGNDLAASAGGAEGAEGAER